MTKQKVSISLVIILGGLTAFGPLSMDMYLPALPQVATDLHTTASLAQLSLTACLIGMAFGQLFFGPLSDKIGRKKPLTSTLVVFALASVLCGFSQSITMLVTMRFIQGFAGAAGIVIARASARDMYSGKDLTKFIALLALVNGSAPILAPIFGGLVLKFTTWHTVFYILAGFALLMLLGVIVKLPETLKPEHRSTGNIFDVFKTFGKLMRDPYFMRLALAQALTTAAMFAYISGSPFVLQNVYHLSPQQFSLCFAFNGIGIIIASQVTAKLSERTDELKLLGYGVAIAAIGAIFIMLSVALQLPVFILLIGLFLIVSMVGVVGPTTFSLAMQEQGNNAGSASAMLGLLPFLGGALVSPLVGLLGEANALPMAIVILTLSLIALINYLPLARYKAQ